jgi:hypothetical protein
MKDGNLTARRADDSYGNLFYDTYGNLFYVTSNPERHVCKFL